MNETILDQPQALARPPAAVTNVQALSEGQPYLNDRVAFNGIVFVLSTVIPWEDLPQELGFGSGMTCWRRLRQWQSQGHLGPAAPGLAASSAPVRPDRLEPGKHRWRERPAPPKGQETGPSPSDRGKLGNKRLTKQQSNRPMYRIFRWLLAGCSLPPWRPSLSRLGGCRPKQQGMSLAERASEAAGLPAGDDRLDISRHAPIAMIKIAAYLGWTCVWGRFDA